MGNKAFIKLELTEDEENLGCEFSGNPETLENMFIAGITNFVNKLVKDDKVDIWLKDFKEELDNAVAKRKLLKENTEDYKDKLDYLLNNLKNVNLD